MFQNNEVKLFKQFVKLIETLFEKKVKTLRFDNGGEFTNKKMNFCENDGILQQTTCVRTQEQNGVCERKNRNLLNITRSITFHMNIPKAYWIDAVACACYLINRTKSRHIKITHLRCWLPVLRTHSRTSEK